MPYYDEIFKHVTAEFPHALAVLALNAPEVEVGDRLATEHTTVRMHHSDMTFHIHLPDEEAILHIEAQTDDSTHKPMPLRMLAYSISWHLSMRRTSIQRCCIFGPLRDKTTLVFIGMATSNAAADGFSIMSSGYMS